MNTHNAYQPSTHPEHWGQHVSPAATMGEPIHTESRDLIPLDMDDDAGEWDCGKTWWDVALVAAFIAAVFAAGLTVGWLWPL